MYYDNIKKILILINNTNRLMLKPVVQTTEK